MIGDEFEAESGGVVVEPGEFLALHFFCFFLEYFGIKWLAIFEEVPKDARQFVRHGRDGFRGSQPGLPAAVEVAKVVLGLVQALRGQSQRGGRPALYVPRGRTHDLAAGDPVVRTQPQPGAEMFGGGEALGKVVKGSVPLFLTFIQGSTESRPTTWPSARTGSRGRSPHLSESGLGILAAP